MPISPGMQSTASYLVPVLVPFTAVLGLIIGSFLNVVIYRLPAGLSVVSPRSSCPKCETPIRGYDNIPVISWMVLGGKCRDCKNPISVRYPLVEAATGVLFAVITVYALNNDPAMLPLLLGLTAVGIALTMIDLDTFRLPDPLVFTCYAMVGGHLVYRLVSGDPTDWSVVGWSTLFWFLAFGIPWLVTFGRGMGQGDVKLAPVLGATLGLLGWGPSLIGYFAGFGLGAFVGVALIMFAKAGRKTKVPFGPFMLIGAFIGILVGEPVFRGYLSLMGLA